MQVSGFPTLYFISGKGDIQLFSGQRSEEDLIDFVEEQSTTAEKTSAEDHSEL